MARGRRFLTERVLNLRADGVSCYHLDAGAALLVRVKSLQPLRSRHWAAYTTSRGCQTGLPTNTDRQGCRAAPNRPPWASSRAPGAPRSRPSRPSRAPSLQPRNRRRRPPPPPPGRDAATIVEELAEDDGRGRGRARRARAHRHDHPEDGLRRAPRGRRGRARRLRSEAGRYCTFGKDVGRRDAAPRRRGAGGPARARGRRHGGGRARRGGGRCWGRCCGGGARARPRRRIY